MKCQSFPFFPAVFALTFAWGLSSLHAADEPALDTATIQAITGIVNSTGQNVGSVALGTHPESFQFEQNGDRIYVNVPKQFGITVVDRKKRAAVAK